MDEGWMGTGIWLGECKRQKGRGMNEREGGRARAEGGSHRPEEESMTASLNFHTHSLSLWLAGLFGTVRATSR